MDILLAIGSSKYCMESGGYGIGYQGNTFRCKTSSLSRGILNHQQECKGLQIHF